MMFWSPRRASAKKSSKGKRPQRMHFRREFERLEDRRLLAVLTVTTTIDELDGGTLANHNGPDGKLSLREAVNLANLNPGPDTIVLPNGTYKITIPGAGEDANQTGDFDVLDNLTIKAAPGAHPVVDGNGFDRVFHIPGGHDGVSLEFDGVVIQGGITSFNGAGVLGDSSGNALTFVDSTVRNNVTTSFGGGIYNSAGDITLLRSHVDGNSATSAVSQGGGIDMTGSVGAITLTNSTVNGNSSGGPGGGIEAAFSPNAFTVINSQISNNHAGGTGGADVDSQFITIDGSTISGNTSTNNGGGLSAFFGAAGVIAIKNKSTFSNNIATNDGGGIFAGGASLIISGSTFTHNTGKNGGAIDDAGAVQATDSYFTYNTASGAADGAGGAIHQETYGDIMILRSTFDHNVANGGVISEGGAINAFNASGEVIRVTDSKLTYNSATGDAGAIYAAGDKVIVLRSTFDHNTTLGSGGAIDDPTAGISVTDSYFTNNQSAFDGGGFNAEGGAVTLIRTVVSNNSAGNGDGGGFSAEKANVTVIDSTISGNSATGNGGGFTADGITLTMTGSTVSGNRAGGSGGGVYVATSGVNSNPYPGSISPGSLIANSTIGDNGAAVAGGGVFFGGAGDLTIINATIVYNASATGGGVEYIAAALGQVHVGNTIIANNTATNGPDVNNPAGSFDDLGHNLIFSLLGSTGFTQLSDIIGVDPKLGPLANNGGPTQTYALLAGSPAIDTADDALAPLTDQRGVARPQGAHADIGAYEYQVPAPVKKGHSGRGKKW